MQPAPDLPRPSLDAETLPGRTVDLERAEVIRHGLDLWRSIGSRDELWGGIPSGPFEDEHAFLDWLDAPPMRVHGADVPLPYAANLEKLALPQPDWVVAAVRRIV